MGLPDGLSEEKGDEEFDPTQPKLGRHLKHLNVMLNWFWKRWRGEYLLELCEAHCCHGGNPNAIPPSVGDVVLVEEDDKPCGLWKLAGVTSLITGEMDTPEGQVSMYLPVPRGCSPCPFQWEWWHSATTTATPVSVGGGRQTRPVAIGGQSRE